MEDLWKVASLDYRIAALADQRAYEEIMRRYHNEEVGIESSPALKKARHSPALPQK
jgi:hypothetical protein